MTIPQVELPVPFEQIPAEVERLRKHAHALDGEARVTRTMIQAVQDCCPHPTEKRHTHHDYGGGSDTVCDHCGKSW